MTPAEDDFWDYSGRVYAAPGVKSAALALQDSHGFDVNLTLFALWVASRHGAVLAQQDFDELTGLLRPWQAGVTRPLRAVRRHIAELTKMPDTRPADSRLDALYSAVLANELTAERVAQGQLVARWRASLGAAQSNLETDPPRRVRARASLYAYAKTIGAEEAVVGPLLETLADAVHDA